jgi:hypothetical protein
MPEAPNRPDAALDRDPQPWLGADGGPPDTPHDWREATLARLEAWIEEEERMIAEIERRIVAAVGNLPLFPSRSSSTPRENDRAAKQAHVSPQASGARR